MRSMVPGIGFAGFLVFFFTTAAHPQAGIQIPATPFPQAVQCAQPMEQQPRMAPVRVNVRVPTAARLLKRQFLSHSDWLRPSAILLAGNHSDPPQEYVPPPCAPCAPRLVKCRVPAKFAPPVPRVSGYSPPFSRGSCAPPMASAPVGPSVAPLLRAGCPSPCEPYLPARIVRDAEFPLLEPRDLMGGLVNLPFRLMQRARLFGDWGKGSESCGR